MARGKTSQLSPHLNQPVSSLPHPLTLKVNAVSANHLQLIDPANIRVLVSTAFAVTDWLIKVTATHIDKDLPLCQSPLWLLGTGP